MNHVELDGSPTTGAASGQAPTGAAPEAPHVLHPGALVKRNWLFILVIALIVAIHLVVIVGLIPTSATATSRVRVVGTTTGSVLDASVEVSPEEERESLIVDLESPTVLRRAAAGAGVPASTVDVVATSPRETLFVDVAVTAKEGQAAVEIANAIPTIVAETRRDRIRQLAEETKQALRAQAEEAIAEAEALEAQVGSIQSETSDDPSTSFRAEQQRNALVAQYAELISQAFSIERRAASPSVGFEVSSPATEVDRSLPPGRDQTIPLALLAGLVVGFGVVALRALVGGPVYREHLEDRTSRHHLGLVRLAQGRLRQDDVHAVAGRLRALPELDDPAAMLIAVVALDTGRGYERATASRLAAALAETGLETAVIAADFDDVGPWSAATGNQTDVRVGLDTMGTEANTVFHVRRSGGSPLAAAYARDTRETIDLVRARHHVVFLDPTDAGVDVEAWLTAAIRPDLVLLVITEGVTTHDEVAGANARLSEAGLTAVTMMVERRSLVATVVPRRPSTATRATPTTVQPVTLARGSSPR